MVSHFLQVNSVEHPFGEASGGNSADWQICLRFFIVDFMGFNGGSMVFQWDSTGFDGEYIWIELDVYYDLIGEMVIWSCH